MAAGRRRAFVVVRGIEGRVGRRLVVLLAWTLIAFAGAAIAWLDHLLRQASRPDLALLVPFAIVPTLAILSAASVGAVLASRRPGHPVGWLLLAVGLLWAMAGVATGCANYGLLAQPGAMPAAARLAAGYDSAGIPLLAAGVGFILLLTPTGSLPSSRWRWWAWVAAAAPLLAVAASALLPFQPPYQSVPNPLAVSALVGPLRTLNGVTWAITGLTVLVAAGSLVVRFRRARGLERQQLRWLAYGAALTGVCAVALVALIPTGNEFLLGSLMACCVVLLPLATGAAILRYRLYDLDYLVSRTVVYGLLTAGGIAVYVAVVKGTEWLLREGADLRGSLLATAVIAVGFAPARDRLQRWVDRRLYGDRHDPVRAVTRLGERLRDAPGGAPGEVLAGVLQGVSEALRLPSAPSLPVLLDTE
jgi:hypothetical protein